MRGIHRLPVTSPGPVTRKFFPLNNVTMRFLFCKVFRYIKLNNKRLFLHSQVWHCGWHSKQPGGNSSSLSLILARYMTRFMCLRARPCHHHSRVFFFNGQQSSMISLFALSDTHPRWRCVNSCEKICMHYIYHLETQYGEMFWHRIQPERVLVASLGNGRT